MNMWMSCAKVKGKLFILAIAVFLVTFTMYMKFVVTNTTNSQTTENNEQYRKKSLQDLNVPLWEQDIDFDSIKNYSNITGLYTGCYLVPNYVHYVGFGGKPLTYLKLICILAAMKNQKPEKLFFHYDNEKMFTGKYWEVLYHTPGFKDIVNYNKVELPSEIFGQPLSPDWKKWHGSDIVRIKMLMKYGGIYLDADSYVVQNLDNYRRFEYTVNWDEGQQLGNQVQISHKDARFLKKYLDCYKVYKMDKWYYNAGERPTQEILIKEPELIHRVKVMFGADTKYGGKMFQEKWEGWRDMHIIHLLASHQYLYKNLSEKAKFPVEFDENNIAFYPMTFREMAYDVYDFANVKWGKTIDD